MLRLFWVSKAASWAYASGFLWLPLLLLIEATVATQNKSLKTIAIFMLNSWISIRSCMVSFKIAFWGGGETSSSIREWDLSSVTSPWNLIWLSRKRCLLTLVVTLSYGLISPLSSFSFSVGIAFHSFCFKRMAAVRNGTILSTFSFQANYASFLFNIDSIPPFFSLLSGNFRSTITVPFNVNANTRYTNAWWYSSWEEEEILGSMSDFCET